MRPLLRVLLASLLLVTLGGGQTLAQQPAPMLGARISPTRLVVEDQPYVTVTNLSDVPVTVALSADAAGWRLDPTTLSLEVDQTARVAIVESGPLPATISAMLRPQTAVPGVDTNALTLQLAARHRDVPVALVPWILGVPLLVLAVIIAILALGRALRHEPA